MVILCMRSVSFEMKVRDRQLVPIAVVLLDERPSGQVGIDHQFENILPQPLVGKVPAVVVGLHVEIETILAGHPADLHRQVELARIESSSPPAVRIVQLGQSDRIRVGHDFPVREIAVDARNRRTRKLENLVLLIGTGERPCTRRDDTSQYNKKQTINPFHRIILFR